MCACVSGSQIVSAIKSIKNSTNNCYGPNSLSGLFTPFYNRSKIVLTATNNAGMAFGTGTVPPSLEDYWLSGDLITTVAILLCTVTTDVGDGSARYTNAITVQNTSATDTIVINEMGIVANLYHSTSTSGVSDQISSNCLVDRTVFDTPLTLAPGAQGVITYTFNIPTV